MGAGFQFLPILGSGSIPAAPFSVRLRSLTGTNTVRGQYYDIAEKVAKLDKENLTFANLLALLSFPGQFITIDNKDTTLSSTINFLGITSFMGQAVNSLERAVKPRIPLADRSNSNLAALYSLAKFSARSVRTLIGLSQAITIVAPNTLYKAGFSLLDLDTKTVIEPKVGKALRRVAPYLLAYSFALI
jgi:hypothetical protein